METSVTTEHAEPQGPRPGRLSIVPIAAWTLWKRPSRVLVYVLAVEAVTALLTIGALRVWAITSSDLTMALTIWGCATLYTEMTRSIERVRERLTPHIDLNSMWMFSAVLLVHPTLVAAIVSANYLHRWLRVRHHVVHRQMFSAAATVLAGYAAMGMLTAADRHPVLSGTPNTTAYLVTVVAAIAYLVVNTMLVSGAIVLSAPGPTFAKLAADPGDTALELAGVGLGVLIAWALIDWPAALTIVFGIALVLHGKVLVPQLRNAARTDPKTGLLNLPAWANAARQRVMRADTDQRIGLLMIDLDHFKLVNDVHGHLIGDEVLLAVAMAITDEVRAGDVVRTDLVGRFGGEEFVVLLREAAESTTVTVAERIRHRIGSISTITTGDNARTDTMVRVTCSVGVAIYPYHGTSLDELLHAADHALRAAKQSGRNQVRLAGLA